MEFEDGPSGPSLVEALDVQAGVCEDAANSMYDTFIRCLLT